MVLLVTGLGAILAIGWELGEWWTFIRHGTELDTAYEDTLGDMSLGTLGALCAGVLLLRQRRATKGPWCPNGSSDSSPRAARTLGSIAFAVRR